MAEEKDIRENELPPLEDIGDNVHFRAVTALGDGGMSVNIPKELAYQQMQPTKEDKNLDDYEEGVPDDSDENNNSWFSFWNSVDKIRYKINFYDLVLQIYYILNGLFVEKPTSGTVLLDKDNWNGSKQQTVTISGLSTSTHRIDFLIPDARSEQLLIGTNGVLPLPLTIDTDEITFECTTVPTADITLPYEMYL